MTTAVQRRRGTNTEHSTFTGLDGEITVNTTTYTLHVHDGSTVGGIVLAKADGSNISTSSIDINGGTIDGTVIGGSTAAAGSFTTLTATSANVNGTITADGLTVDGTGTAITLRSNNNAGTALNTLQFLDQDGSASADQPIGNIEFYSSDTNSAGVAAYITSLNGTGSTGDITIGTGVGGSAVDRMKVEFTGDIAFYDDTGVSQSFYWDASAESLGIGTSSPSHPLTVKATSTNAIKLIGDDDGTAKILWRSATDSAAYAQIQSTVNKDLQFSIDGTTEAMRIDASGNLLVGTTDTDPASNNVNGFAVSSTGVISASKGNEAVANFSRRVSDGDVVVLKKGGTAVGSISVTASATAYNTSSDYRLKENVVEMADASNRVLALNPVRFNFIADPNKTVDGFLAHEAQAVVPEAVHGVKDKVDDEGNPVYQGIDQSKLVPLLTKALQEALLRIEALEAQVGA